MFHPHCKCCAAMWWSGFFGLASAAHILRLILRFPVQIGTHVIPLSLSVVIAFVAGILSFILCQKADAVCPCGKGDL